jgi:hypothetical protein
MELTDELNEYDGVPEIHVQGMLLVIFLLSYVTASMYMEPGYSKVIFNGLHVACSCVFLGH